MPNVIVKLWPGKSAERKRRLTAAIVDDVTDILGYGPDWISVALEEVASADWSDSVYGPDIARQWHRLAKRPGYGPGPAPSTPEKDK
ncbi:tautomerase family protein [Sphingomonas sp.]|uniref:tautomerase family protein n=1 Tax=Sphingomonas sp. TaxID=28214 RepID=UPI001ED0F313|nr:tautomerase family protein [Sphingomonas sp.]MBX3594848.1 tautomerase family protein [Sphingomonas sp.]